MEFEPMDMFGAQDQPQLMDPVDAANVDPSFAPLPLNYPGQSTAMRSNMQMRLGGPGMGYSTQAMSGMWSKAYGQSQLMSFVPQVSTMQAPGAYHRKPKKKRARPPQTRRVSFSDDVPEVVKEESVTVSEYTQQLPEAAQIIQHPEVTRHSEEPGDAEAINDPGVIEDQIHKDDEW